MTEETKPPEPAGTPRKQSKRQRASFWARTILIVTMAAWVFPKMAVEGYDYFVAAPCRDALKAAEAKFMAADTDSEDVKVIAAYWVQVGREFRDELAVPMCPDAIDVKRDALVVAMDKWVAFMETTAATGEFNIIAYIEVKDAAATALAELKSTMSASEQTK